ncbi:hypothetical protein JTE90_017306 [Oedothorax gibbosus]|uniref:EF-hand domain-containing protein n=1 Tax=Oedothorax gibbosus TaxID=931172 RepID=A0AAV6UBY7_9ARAC|nr:hypothetical protein JTE90_017306 [Oedothorax gibbosus]
MESLVDNDINFIERFLNAFKTLGGNEFGFIDYEQFKQVLRHKNSAETKEITDLINAEHHVKDGKLDFVNLCYSILSTKQIFNRSFENGRVAGSQINTHTFTRNKSAATTGLQTNKVSVNSSSEKSFHKCLRGLLFNINGDKLGHRYQLELQENATVEINAKKICNTGQNISSTPIEILVFQEGKNKVFVTSSTFIKEDGYCSVKVSLKKGKYILIPILLKWNAIGKSNSFDSLNFESLIHFEEDSEVTLTPACESALKLVFDSIDLDENGLLSQLEFDYFIQHTSGETAADEWSTIEDNFKMENGQLTFEGFLELYRDPSDVMNMLQQMGMNESLEIENAQPFHLVVKSDSPKLNFHPLPVSSFKEVSDKVLKKITIEQGSTRKLKDMNDLFLFTQQLPHRTTIVVQNQSHGKLDVRLDCSQSTNCESHQGELDYTIELLPRTSVIGHHLFPIDVTQNVDLNCIESLK